MKTHITTTTAAMALVGSTFAAAAAGQEQGPLGEAEDPPQFAQHYFPEDPDEYVQEWVAAWSQGDHERSQQLAPSAPATMVQCLDDTSGEWSFDAENPHNGDMSDLSGGTDLWWTTMVHEPTGAELYVYTDQNRWSAAEAVVGADLHGQGGGVPELKDCWATDVYDAVEAWGSGDLEPITAMVSADLKDELDGLEEDFTGEDASLDAVGSMQYYGGDDDGDYQPTVSAVIGFDDDRYPPPPGIPMYQLWSEDMDAGTSTDDALYRMTWSIGLRFPPGM